MNPSITQLISSESNHDQSASQIVSKVKKTINGKQKMTGLFDLIGGEGSFASLLKQKYIPLPIEKGRSEKEGPESCEAESTTGKYKIKKVLSDINIGRVFLSPWGANGVEEVSGEIEASPFGGQVLDEKDVKHDPEILSSVGAGAKTDGKMLTGEFGKSRSLSGEGLIEKCNKLNLLKRLNDVQVKDGAAGRSESVADKENEFSVKKDVSGFGSVEKLQSGGQSESVADKGNEFSVKKDVTGFGNVEKLQSGDAKHSDGEASHDLGVLSAGGFKSDRPVRKNVPEEMRISRSGDALEDHKNDGDLDVSNKFAVKELSASRGSSDARVKAHEALLAKDGILHSEGTMEDVIPTNQVRTENEKLQNYKNISSGVVKSERSVERGANETPDRKIDTSLLTAQVDYSGVKGVWNGSETSMKGDIITPLNFHDVADQIMDAASNVLKKDSGRIVITLEPPNLGTLNMDVRVQHDTVRMLLVADNYEVKQVLHSNLDQLKTALQGQGLNIDRLDVLVHDRSYDGNQGFQPGGGAVFDDGRGGRNNTKEDHPALQILQSGGNELNEPYLGIISLFA